MDPFTISTGIAGFLSLALEISKILSAYISDVKSAPSDVENLLQEFKSLCTVLDQLINLLKDDVKGDFQLTSALCVAITACRELVQELYKKVGKLRCKPDSGATGKIKEIVKRTVEWPLKKEELSSTLVALHRFVQTFQFSVTVTSWLVIPFLSCSNLRLIGIS
jgi:hypothetical protein